MHQNGTNMERTCSTTTARLSQASYLQLLRLPSPGLVSLATSFGGAPPRSPPGASGKDSPDANASSFIIATEIRLEGVSNSPAWLSPSDIQVNSQPTPRQLQLAPGN